jgi:hypothetical protein
VAEVRHWRVLDVDPEAGSWTLEFAAELTNTAGEPLHFAEPAPFGRELPGHCGFFWRGPESVSGAGLIQPAGFGPVEAGARAPWTAITGAFGAEPGAGPADTGAGPGPMEQARDPLPGTVPHTTEPRRDPARHTATVVLAADPRLPGGAPYWRVRSGRAPVIEPRPALGRSSPLAPGSTLRLAYRLVVADGGWDRDRITAHLAAHPW